MTHKSIALAIIAALFLQAAPLSYADTISQTVDTATASAPDLVPGFGVYDGFTYTYGLGTGLSGTLNSLKLKFDGRAGNSWALEFFCKTGTAFSSSACASSFGNATSHAPSATTGNGTAEYTATWGGTNTFESDKYYFFQLRVSQPANDSTPATLSGSATDRPEGTCESSNIDGGCAALPDPYFVLDYTPPVPVDSTPPAISITSGIAEGAHTASSTPYFEFTSDDVAATYQCAWDGMATSSCTSPASQALVDGARTFAIIAADTTGNTATTTRTFVVDTAAPVLSAMPTDQTVEATGASTTVSYTLPTATDAVEGVLVASCSPASGWGFALGSTTVSCTAADSVGNTSATSTFVVGVVDTTAPVISNTPSNITTEATAASTTASYTLPDAFDTVSGTTTVVCTPASGWGFALGSTTVSCSTQDGAGNTATSSFVVGVVDTTAPVVTRTGAATTTLTQGSTFTDPGATATDLGAALAVITSGSVDTNTPGTYTLVYTATDTSGNAASTTRAVIVEAPAPPSGGGGGGSVGNGPPVPNPSQGLPQGIVLGSATQAVQNASERAREVITSILPSVKVSAPGTPKKAEAPEIVLPKVEPTPPQTPWDLPKGQDKKQLSATVIEAQGELPFGAAAAGLIGLVLIVALGFAYLPRA